MHTEYVALLSMIITMPLLRGTHVLSEERMLHMAVQSP